MLRLLLLRHSKAERAIPGERDHERRLAERGREDAPKIGAYLAKHRCLPDKVVVSTSARTRETWSLAAAAMSGKPKVAFDERIYEAAPEHLLAVLRETAKSVKTLLMIGHNPGIHELAVELSASGDLDARQRMQEGFPTSGLAVIEFALDSWERVHAHSGRLEHFITPRTLEGPSA